MAKSVAPKNDNEKLVVDFIHAAYGESMDIDGMTALMADDFVWQLHVPLSPVVRGRDAARAELEKHNTLSTGMVEGSEIRTILSDGDSVVVERVDVNSMNGVAVTFYVTAFFGVRDGSITYWREYWDTTHVAQQLGIDPALMFAPLSG
ncbi:nuclear transport factor 2 family protein [Mycobacterium sp. 852014-50255_SCH5639931]|uniref:limonene-1,2-epoxide hydrolase family protein n=1 Tax=Mycobacterium sp. 852014-50255_SCH5639931 TaxID=1834112 RepID=UPI0007FFBE10|nr:nuclear transport factor 2 family protein [Mycobacterium sp. 852014-50255_SCH5639931]OBB64114.1 terpene synthase [Mycobacterium sp. 852014-50255_SCH5639931]